jgi:Tfp pilus assembly protein PilZ
MKDRIYPRVAVGATADISSDDLSLFNKVDNISLGGACIQAPTIEKVGTMIELAITLPESEDDLVLIGEVVWTSDFPDPKMGVRFVDMNDELKTRLRDYIYKKNNY